MAFLQPHTANLTQHAACVAPETNQAVSAGKKHHSQADDLWACFEVPERGVFCHTERLRDHPAGLKLVLSDSALINVLYSLDYEQSGLLVTVQ